MSHEPSPIVPTPPSRLSTFTSHLSTFLSEAAYYFSWYIAIAIILKMLLISIVEVIYFIRYCDLVVQAFLWRALSASLLTLLLEKFGVGEAVQLLVVAVVASGVVVAVAVALGVVVGVVVEALLW